MAGLNDERGGDTETRRQSGDLNANITIESIDALGTRAELGSSARAD